MLPADFKEKNFTFTKPEDMTDAQCGSLPVWKGNTSDGMPCIISKWQLSPAEMEEVQKTGCVYLSITGQGMPPVSVFTANPFEPK